MTRQFSATLLGSTSILMWAMWPALAVYAAPAPTFQVLSLGMAIGFCTLAALRLLRGESLREMVPKSRGLLLAGVIGILGTNAFNFMAIVRIPPAQASVIAYLWPMLALLLAGTLGLKSLARRHIIAIVLGFTGTVFVINPFGGVVLDFLGICFALLAALSFATYTTYRLIDSESASDAVGLYALIASAACAIVHFAIEEHGSMDIYQICAVIGLGLAPMGLANAVWDYGVSRGDARVLSILAYATPLVAALFLILLGLDEITCALVIGALIITLGAAIGTWPSADT